MVINLKSDVVVKHIFPGYFNINQVFFSSRWLNLYLVLIGFLHLSILVKSFDLAIGYIIGLPAFRQRG